MLAQTRQELGEVARLVPDVELVLEDVVPAVAACAGRARQHKDIGAGQYARIGAGLNRRRADLLEADPAEQFAEPVDPFLRDIAERLGRDIAAGDAGSAGRDNHLDLGVGGPAAELVGDRRAVVANDIARGENMAGFLHAFAQRVARAVIVHVAGVGDRQNGDADRLELRIGLSFRHLRPVPCSVATGPRQYRRGRASSVPGGRGRSRDWSGCVRRTRASRGRVGSR